MKRIDSVIASTGVEPRPYQRKIIEKVSTMFTGKYRNLAGQAEPAARSVMIESPTGSGKTCMGHLAAKVMQSEYSDLVIGWVAMRRNLLSQARVENARLGINVRDIHYISMFDKSPEVLVNARRERRKVLLVVDEAQHDAADSMSHLHNLVEPEFILGLTATPFRTDRVKLCFDKVVKDAGIHQLIQDGYLSRYEHFTIPKWDVDTVAAHYCREPERWGKSIFYYRDLVQCFRLVDKLRENESAVLERLRKYRPDLSLAHGLVEIVTGSSNEETREEQLARFRNGEVACLVNCMVLTEGFDDPTLETAWVRDSMRGPTMQMAGRVFRMHPAWKNGQDRNFKFKRVVQSKDTKWPMLKTAMADQQYLWQEDGWRSLTVNPQLNAINQAARLAIAQTPVTLPKFLLDQQEKRRRFEARRRDR